MIQYAPLSAVSFLFLFSTNFHKGIARPLFSFFICILSSLFTWIPYSLFSSSCWVKCTPNFFLAKSNGHYVCLSSMISQQYLMPSTPSLKCTILLSFVSLNSSASLYTTLDFLRLLLVEVRQHFSLCS